MGKSWNRWAEAPCDSAVARMYHFKMAERRYRRKCLTDSHISTNACYTRYMVKCSLITVFDRNGGLEVFCQNTHTQNNNPETLAVKNTRPPLLVCSRSRCIFSTIYTSPPSFMWSNTGWSKLTKHVQGNEAKFRVVHFVNISTICIMGYFVLGIFQALFCLPLGIFLKVLTF